MPFPLSCSFLICKLISGFTPGRAAVKVKFKVPGWPVVIAGICLEGKPTGFPERWGFERKGEARGEIRGGHK